MDKLKIIIVSEQGKQTYREFFLDLGHELVTLSYSDFKEGIAAFDTSSIIFFNLDLLSAQKEGLLGPKVLSHHASIFMIRPDEERFFPANYNERFLDYMIVPPSSFGIKSKIDLVLALWSVRREITQLRSSANKNNEQMQLFISAFAHEISAPVRHVRLAFESLQSEANKNLIEEQSSMIGHILKGVNKIEKIGDELTEFARSWIKSDSFMQLNMNNIFDAVIEDLRPEIEKASILIEVERRLPRYKLSMTGMTIVIKNIIKNAIAYSKPQNPKIEVACEWGCTFSTIFIKDNGIGIEEKYLGKILEPFKRLHRSDDVNGLGLGLFITRKIVEGMGGSIDISSKIHLGTTVSLRFPNFLLLQARNDAE